MKYFDKDRVMISLLSILLGLVISTMLYFVSNYIVGYETAIIILIINWSMGAIIGYIVGMKFWKEDIRGRVYGTLFGTIIGVIGWFIFVLVILFTNPRRM